MRQNLFEAITRYIINKKKSSKFMNIRCIFSQDFLPSIFGQNAENQVRLESIRSLPPSSFIGSENNSSRAVESGSVEGNPGSSAPNVESSNNEVRLVFVGFKFNIFIFSL